MKIKAEKIWLGIGVLSIILLVVSGICFDLYDRKMIVIFINIFLSLFSFTITGLMYDKRKKSSFSLSRFSVKGIMIFVWILYFGLVYAYYFLN